MLNRNRARNFVAPSRNSISPPPRCSNVFDWPARQRTRVCDSPRWRAAAFALLAPCALYAASETREDIQLSRSWSAPNVYSIVRVTYEEPPSLWCRKPGYATATSVLDLGPVATSEWLTHLPSEARGAPTNNRQ
jgi:hypothetical protein